MCVYGCVCMRVCVYVCMDEDERERESVFPIESHHVSSCHYLLLNAVEKAGIVSLPGHQLGMGAMLCYLPIPHEDHIITLSQVLPKQQHPIPVSQLY